LAEEIGVVDDGREEVEGLDEGEIGGDAVNSGVVRAGGTNEKVGVLDVGDATQDLREFGLAELRGSPSARGHFGQAFDIFATHMEKR
jgi:hypothetical protein